MSYAEWMINIATIDRYTQYIREELDAPHPNFARIASLARSVGKLAEAELFDDTLKPGD